MVVLVFRGAIKAIFEWIDGLLSSVSNMPELAMSLDSFNTPMYTVVQTTMNGVVMTIANIILALFVMLELHKVALRMEGAGGAMGYEMPMKVMIKAAICKVVLDNAGRILTGIYNTALFLIDGIRPGDVNMNILDLAVLNDALDNQLRGFGFELLGLIISLAVFGVVAVTCVAAQVTVIARFVELYIYMAIAPIPIATIVNEEHSSIAKNFLKNFAAVAFQGVLLMLVVALVPSIINGAFNALNVVTGWGFVSELLKIAGMSCVLLMAIRLTKKWSTSIANAM
jgi:hypothetical protein